MARATQRPVRTRSASLLGALAGLLCAATASGAHAASAKQISSNWSGYAVTRSLTSSRFARVSGSWIEPAGKCVAGAATYAVMWVGLGGFSQSAKTLEQTGTEVDCTRAAKAAYSVWYELVPRGPVEIRMALHPGDRISAVVAVKGKKVTVRVKDLSTGSSRVIYRSMSDPDQSSAEWIAEAPSTCFSSGTCLALPLTDFGTVSFSDASASTVYGHTGSIGDPDYLPTELELRSDRRRSHGARAQVAASLAGAEPSLLSAAGDQFKVTWLENAPADVEAAPPSFPGAGDPLPAGS